MADDVPRLDLGLTGEGKPVVLLGTRGEQATDMATLLRLAPGLASPAHAADLALAVNHLAHSGEYRVITDPQAFEHAYRTRLAGEDPNAPWHEGVVRLRDYGVPDFTQVHAPSFTAGRLTFYAVDMYLGVPYRVELTDLLAAPTYAPLPLTPLPGPSQPGPAQPEPAPELTPLTPEERAARQTHMPSDLPASR